MIKMLSLLAALLAATIIPTAVAAAQEVGATSSTLETITITSTRVDRALAEVPLSISVVGEEQIRDQPMPEASDYIQLLPGVQVNKNSYAQYQFSLRGHGSDRTMILIDGIKQRMATTLNAEEAGGINLDPSEIERIEIIKGPASALYGSDAIGGVVNIITKKPFDRPFGFEVGLLYDGSTEGLNPRAAIYGNHAGFYWRLAGSYFDAGELKLPGGATYWHSDYERQNYSGKMGYRWDQGSIDVAVSRFKGKRLIPGINALTRKQLPPSIFLLPSGSRYSEIPDEWRNSISASLTLQNLSPVVQRVLATTYFINEKTDIDFKLNSIPAPYQAINLAGSSTILGFDEGRSFGASVLADLALFDNNLLTVGVDFEKNTAHSTAVYGGLQKRAGTKDEDRRGFSQAIAVLAQDQWDITSDWGLTLGLRYTWIENGITQDAAYPQRISKSKDNNFVGSLGVVYSGIENLSLRALYSQGFRAPTLSGQMGKTQRSLPNPSLKPETSDNFELGARYFAHGLNVDLSLFYSVLDQPFYDASTTVPHPSGRFYTRTVNADRVKNYGAELFLSYDIESLYLTPYISITAISYEREVAGNKTKDTGIPRGWGTAGLKFSKEFGGNVRFFSDASFTWSGGHHNVDFTTLSGATGTNIMYSSGWKADLTVGLEYGEDHRVRTSLSFKNIGDREYEPWGFYQPGFHMVGSLSYEF
ncbi:MAG: TonB-dependent receptor [Deltaproteobacteria bacterium]|jgi:hemoglobin/transferrin/lactoferrin receptor protein|nr:TonB-dependent receptor [Deltaproteobacteria bacterium]